MKTLVALLRKKWGGGVTPIASQIITKIRVICVIMVVLMHSNVAHLVSQENSLICNGIIRFLANYASINILFILSGYFYFIKDKTFTYSSYYKKLIKRIMTLLIPYIIWCIIGFIFNLTVGQKYEGNIFQILIDIFWGSPIIEGHPSGRAMWYIRNLMVFAIFSPIYYLTAKYLKHFTLIIIAITSLSNIGPSYDYPFFSPYLLLGVYLATQNFSFDKFCSMFKTKYIISLVIIISILNIITELFYYPEIITTIIFLIFMYKISERINISQVIIASSTFLYMSHMYITSILRNFFIMILPNNIISCLFAIIATWVITIFICSRINILMKKYTPKILTIIVGGRI